MRPPTQQNHLVLRSTSIVKGADGGLPGVTVYGRTPKLALAAAESLAMRVIVDRVANGEAVPK
jgi:hypothetical protein